MPDEVKRWWRLYRTTTGAEPVRQFILSLDQSAQDAVAYAMREARVEGRSAARHLDGDIYELRVSCEGRAYRLLFSAEGRRHQVLLGLSSFEKKTQKTPDRELALAKRRLSDWRQRGR
jgi:phage-related protein